MTISIDGQIEYCERLRVTAQRQLDRDGPTLPVRVKRQMEKDLRAIEATLDTLREAKDGPQSDGD